MPDTNPETATDNAPSSAKTAKSPKTLLTIATTVYAFALVMIVTANHFGPENWWPFGLNLYLPQWIWALPLLVLFPWVLLRARRRIWMPLALALLVFGPIMGGTLRLSHANAPADKGVRLRVMTYNIKWAQRDVKAIEGDIEQYKPDLMLMQDAGGGLNPEMGQFLKGWNVQAVDQYIIASRLPLTDMDIRWISYPEQNHRVERCILHATGQDIVVYSCHLESPRYGLAAMKHPRKGLDTLLDNIDIRVKQSAQLAKHLQSEHMPLIATGDLNAPIQSLVCKNLLGVGMTDAFAAAGAGYGYTYGETTKVGSSYVRIDHIFTSPQWQVLNCWVGNSVGSDHCPVFAELYLPEHAN